MTGALIAGLPSTPYARKHPMHREHLWRNCLDAHMRAARHIGATLEEIFDVLLVADAMAESSTLSVAFRRFRPLEEKGDESVRTDE